MNLGGLHDEYIDGYGYPNCANNQQEAELWWGNYIGQIDPFYYEYKQIVKNLSGNTQLYLINEEDFKVGYISQGCSEDSLSSKLRPTKMSIMNHYVVPIFGSVNRARIEQILNLFGGDLKSNVCNNCLKYKKGYSLLVRIWNWVKNIF